MRRRRVIQYSRPKAEMNLTSMMDLTFILLITFIITFPLIEQGIPVRLPKGKASELDQANTFTITLNDKAEIFFDEVPTGAEALAAELKAKAAENPDVTILVRADEGIAYGKVVAILRLMHDANISRMALVTSPEK